MSFLAVYQISREDDDRNLAKGQTLMRNVGRINDRNKFWAQHFSV